MDAKIKFIRKYPGPRGLHLSCLTETTMTGTFDSAKQKSIHPRVAGGRTVHHKVNTCKAASA